MTDKLSLDGLASKVALSYSFSGFRGKLGVFKFGVLIIVVLSAGKYSFQNAG